MVGMQMLTLLVVVLSANATPSAWYAINELSKFKKLLLIQRNREAKKNAKLNYHYY